MTFRTVYELLLIAFAIIVIWHLIVKPGYALATGRSLKVNRDTTAGDTLSAAEQELQDQAVLAHADRIKRRAELLREKRTQPTKE